MILKGGVGLIYTPLEGAFSEERKSVTVLILAGDGLVIRSYFSVSALGLDCSTHIPVMYFHCFCIPFLEKLVLFGLITGGHADGIRRS